MSSRVFAGVLFPLGIALLCGCGGGGEFDVAPVTGKVLCEGEPVTAGFITFTPIAKDKKGEPGKPAAGIIQPDGTFELTTYEPGDGAVVGKHNVTYSPPMAGEEGGGEEEELEEGESASTPPPVQKHACRLGGSATATVKAGDNNLTIELSPGMPSQQGGEREF